MILFQHGLYCRIRQLSLMIHSCWNSMFDHCSSCYGTMAPFWHNQGTNTTLSYVCFLSNENPYNCLYTIRFCAGFCWSGEVRGHDVTVVICYIYRGLCTYTYSILLCLYVHITILFCIFTHVFVGPKTIAQLIDLQTSGGCRCGGGHGAAAQLAVGTQRDPGVSRCSAGGGRKKHNRMGLNRWNPK